MLEAPLLYDYQRGIAFESGPYGRSHNSTAETFLRNLYTCRPCTPQVRLFSADLRVPALMDFSSIYLSPMDFKITSDESLGNRCRERVAVTAQASHSVHGSLDEGRFRYSHEVTRIKTHSEPILNFLTKGSPYRFNLVRWVLHKPFRATGFEQCEHGFGSNGVPM